MALCEPHLRILLQRGLEMQKSFKFQQHLRTVLQIKSTQTLYECLQSSALILLFIGRHNAKLDCFSVCIFSKLCINPCCTWHIWVQGYCYDVHRSGSASKLLEHLRIVRQETMTLLYPTTRGGYRCFGGVLLLLFSIPEHVHLSSACSSAVAVESITFEQQAELRNINPSHNVYSFKLFKCAFHKQKQLLPKNLMKR